MSRGSQEGVKFKTIRAGHKIKNWRRLLTCTETKNKFTKFLADSWQEPSRREKLCGQTMFVACQEWCFKLTCNTCEEVYLLATSQEEAASISVACGLAIFSAGAYAGGGFRGFR